MVCSSAFCLGMLPPLLGVTKLKSLFYFTKRLVGKNDNYGKALIYKVIETFWMVNFNFQA